MMNRRRQQGVVFFIALLMTYTAEIAAASAALAAIYNGEKVIQGAVELYHAIGTEKQPAQ